MIGHSFFSNPKISQRAKPMTVTTYIQVEIALVSRLLMIFQACGAKLVIEQSAAP
jgi:hypothetical protein